jgi:hypothetical protein
MKLDAKDNFKAKGIKLSVDWTQPTGDAGKQYVEAFPEAERSVTDSSNKLFVAVSTNRYHVDQVTDIGKQFADFIDGICDAICTAWQGWTGMATISMSMVNACVGVIPPGGVVGPPFYPLAMAVAPKFKPNMAKYANAILTAIGNAWTAWQTGYTGQLTFPPTFATCPSPVHPPTPNIPKPIKSTGSSPGEAMLQPGTLAQAMAAILADPSALHHKALFDSIATAFKKHFDQWVSQTMVKSVLGTGPVPTFAPPIAPMGPVAAGVANGIPGVVFA